MAAPSEQITALQATMLSINQARIAYDDELQAQAAAREKQLFDLKAELQTQTDAAEKSAHELKVAEAEAAECKPAAKTTPAHHRRHSTTSSKRSPATPATQKPQ